MTRLFHRLRGILRDVEQTAYRLHPSSLDHLGLSVALKSYCADFGKQNGIAMSCTERNIPRAIPPRLGLTIYRVAQEALRNVVRHSGARKAQVQLQGCFGGIELIVSDTGSGFEMTPERLTGGLGLTSMYERVSLLQGELTIESNQLRGTRIGAWVPLPKAEVNGPKELK